MPRGRRQQHRAGQSESRRPGRRLYHPATRELQVRPAQQRDHAADVGIALRSRHDRAWYLLLEAAAERRLGGQHAEYLLAQLKAFKAGTRGDDKAGKDVNGHVMFTIASRMTDDEMQAVAQYAAGLR